MSQVKMLVIMQLKSALIYLPGGLCYAAGLTCFVLFYVAFGNFVCIEKSTDFSGGGLSLAFSFF